jgi:hypothetical protein
MLPKGQRKAAETARLELPAGSFEQLLLRRRVRILQSQMSFFLRPAELAGNLGFIS